MRIFIGADHRGFKLKEELKLWLVQQGHDVVDVGASMLVSDDDYVDFAAMVSRKVSEYYQTPDTRHQTQMRGVVLCGSGVGVDIVANRHKGVRCGLGISPEQVRAARHDDNINVLALASDYMDEEAAKALVTTFLATEFSGEERYKRRTQKIDQVFH